MRRTAFTGNHYKMSMRGINPLHQEWKMQEYLLDNDRSPRKCNAAERTMYSYKTIVALAHSGGVHCRFGNTLREVPPAEFCTELRVLNDFCAAFLALPKTEEGPDTLQKKALKMLCVMGTYHRRRRKQAVGLTWQYWQSLRAIAKEIRALNDQR